MSNSKSRIERLFEDATERQVAIHSAEREVLEACVKWCETWDADWAGDYGQREKVLLESSRRYRALLDGKAEGKEA